MQFNKKLQVIMVKKSVSGKELATIIGVSQATVATWRNRPKVKLQLKHAEALVEWSAGEISLKDCGIERF